eukprot:SAG31_NODE_1173_length_9543_cov_8.654913_8_plen_252_part_00
MEQVVQVASRGYYPAMAVSLGFWISVYQDEILRSDCWSELLLHMLPPVGIHLYLWHVFVDLCKSICYDNDLMVRKSSQTRDSPITRGVKWQHRSEAGKFTGVKWQHRSEAEINFRLQEELRSARGILSLPRLLTQGLPFYFISGYVVRCCFYQLGPQAFVVLFIGLLVTGSITGRPRRWPTAPDGHPKTFLGRSWRFGLPRPLHKHGHPGHEVLLSCIFVASPSLVLWCLLRTYCQTGSSCAGFAEGGNPN